MSVDLDKLETTAKAAEEELRRLCDGKKFRMCIPAREDDSDLVLARALGSIPTLITRVRELEEVSAAVGQFLGSIGLNSFSWPAGEPVLVDDGAEEA